MNAVLKEWADVAPSSHLVFDAAGSATENFTPPETELLAEDFYGSITSQFETRPSEKIRNYLGCASIAIRFEKFTDGRPYTLAHRLRELGYAGELHAVGDINQELIHHLRRVGFTHFHLPNVARATLDYLVLYPFGGHYQRTAVENVSRSRESADTFDMFAID